MPDGEAKGEMAGTDGRGLRTGGFSAQLSDEWKSADEESNTFLGDCRDGPEPRLHSLLANNATTAIMTTPSMTTSRMDSCEYHAGHASDEVMIPDDDSKDTYLLSL